MSKPFQPMLDLLSQADATIFRVLCEPCLMAAIRNSCPQFVKFITNKDNMAILMDIVLTNKYANLENYNQILKSALILLTSQTTGVMSPIMMNMVYMSKIFDFVSSTEVRNPQISGNFLRIVLSMAKYTRGEFLRDIPDFENWIISNCCTWAQKELLASVLIEYPKFINVDEELATKLAQKIHDQKETYVASAVVQVFRNSFDLTLIFHHDEIVEILFDSLSDPENSKIKTVVVFSILNYLQLSGFNYKTEMVEKYSKIFFENYKYDDYVLSFALQVLKTTDENIFSKLYDPSVGSRLKTAIFKQFNYMTSEQLYDYITQSQINIKLLELAQTKKRDVSFTLFTKLLEKTGLIIDGWLDGLHDLGIQIELLDTDYGGELPPPLEVNYSLLASDKIITL